MTAPDPPAPRLFLFGAMALAFALRLVTLPALTQGGLRLLSADDYGHLRRAAATVRSFPRVPVFDPYLNHPEGGVWIWPPLFDLAIAAPARLLFGAEASVGQVALVAAWVPPVLGALALLPLFFLAVRAFDDRTARLAVLVAALLPGAIAWSDFGHADQHVGEALAFLATLAAFARLLGSPPGWKDNALAGLALGLAVLTWQGSLFLVPLVAGACFLAGRARDAGQALAIAALLTAPFGLLTPGPVTYVSFGAFQPLFLGLCAVLLLLASLGRWGLAAAGGLALVSLAWPPVSNGVLHLLSRTPTGEIAEGGYLSYPAEWLRLIAEYQPLFAGGFARPLGQLSVGLLMLPIALFIWARRAWKERGIFLLLALTTAGVLAMTLMQRRYLYYLAPLVALAVADLVVTLGRRRSPALATLLLVAVLLSCLGLRELGRAPGAPGPDFLVTLARLAALDPPPGDPLRPDSVRPGEVEGVMAPWAIGHTVTLLTRRPAAADNFGYGFHRQARLLTTPAEEDAEAFRLLRETRCRYLITTDLRPVLPAYAAAVGRTGLPAEATLAVRVHESDSPQPLPFLRLVLVSESVWPTPDGRLIPRWKIFRVEGF
ncbi:MAG TPA: STT3 domain-containing protein [Thermoanaerobaculia bacterium]|nr:STT3 domain-containing protein [Thermoanaerobaculia bacterium]